MDLISVIVFLICLGCCTMSLIFDCTLEELPNEYNGHGGWLIIGVVLSLSIFILCVTAPLQEKEIVYQTNLINGVKVKGIHTIKVTNKYVEHCVIFNEYHVYLVEGSDEIEILETTRSVQK